MKNEYSKKIILGIDTSCDETSVAVVKGRQVLSSVVSSHAQLHSKWGGVVPNISRRAHIERLPQVYKEALSRARIGEDQIEALAVTIGPGLAIDLEIGIEFARDLATKLEIPYIPTNHMMGHLLSPFLLNRNMNGPVGKNIDINELLPAYSLLVSGKHTEIVYFEEIGKFEKLAKTKDDAAGEAFDKVGRMLGFGYPAGGVVAKFARGGKKDRFGLPIPMLHDPGVDFSFSGMKTACLYKLEELRESGMKDKDFSKDFAAEFQHKVINSIERKFKRVLQKDPRSKDVKSLWMGGGVIANTLLVKRISKICREHNILALVPEKKYRGDNGAMIAIAGAFNLAQGKYMTEAFDTIDRIPRLSLEDEIL